MRLRNFLLGVFGSLAIAALSGVQAKEIPGSTSSVSGWRLGAYTNDNTDKFSHCSISMPYRSGISMMFAVSNDFTWRVAWTHQSWNLVTGQSVDLEMYFDGAGPYRVTAKAVNDKLVTAELASTAAIFDSFRKSYVLTVTALGNKYGFNLDGTFAALSDVLECTKRYVQGPTVAPPPPMTSGVKQTATPTSTLTVTAEQKLEATTLVANILGQGDLSNFKILTAKERKAMDENGAFDSWHVVWKADDVLGLLRIVPKGVVKTATDLSTAILADDARGCKGKFASGSAADEKSKDVVRLFTGCNDKDGSFEYRYSVVPVDDGGFYVFATIGKSKDGERPEAVNTADHLLRAAVYQVLKK